MTKREVLTKIVCAYIQGCGKFPSLSADGKLNPAWYTTVEAICNKYPEVDTTSQEDELCFDVDRACVATQCSTNSDSIGAKTYDY